MKFDSNLSFALQAGKAKGSFTSGLEKVNSIARDPHLLRSLRVLVQEAMTNQRALYGAEVWSWSHSAMLRSLDVKVARVHARLEIDPHDTSKGFDDFGSGTAVLAIHGRDQLLDLRDVNLLCYWFRCMGLSEERLPRICFEQVRFIGSINNEIDLIFAKCNSSRQAELDELNARRGTDAPYGGKEFRRTFLRRTKKIRDAKNLHDLKRSKIEGVCIDRCASAGSIERFTCLERNKLRCGCDPLQIYFRDCVKSNDAKKCPFCGEHNIDKLHCVFECEGWGAARRELENSLSPLALELWYGGDKFGLANILNPENWSKQINLAINTFCKKFCEIANCIIFAGNCPTLAPLIRSGDKFPLRDNILGEVFDMDFPEEGKFRIRVMNYNYFTNRFAVDCTKLDVYPARPQEPYFSEIDIDLNACLANKQLEHISNPFLLPNPDKLFEEPILGANIIGRNIRHRKKKRGRFHFFRVVSYTADSGTHLIRNASGSQSVNLNVSLLQGNLRDALPDHILSHIRALQQSRPLAAWPMPPSGMADNTNTSLV